MKFRKLFGKCGNAIFAVMVCMGSAAPAEDTAVEKKLAIEKQDGSLRITVGEKEFATVDYAHYAKPIVYPIYGPGQVPMTRNHPMKPGVEGEADDHPHHKSMWFGHGDVNGIDFWTEKGKVVHDHIESIDNQPTAPSVTLHSKLIGPDGRFIAKETEKLTFRATADARMIDWDVSIHASEGDLRFGDTKEGVMAIRTHPNLRLRGDVANGTAVNSDGGSGKSIWGKAAKWVDYSGTIDDKVVGIAIFDHPQNLRHPSRWHARDYGLVAANPFGLSYFVDKSQDGTYVVPKGETIRFQYRFVFHKGTTEDANVAAMYEAYTKTDLVAED